MAGVKIFEVEDGVDLTNYVRKSGDTMSGGLGFKRPKGGTYTTITSSRPVGWESDGKPQFGMILDITDGNTFKHSFQIKGRRDNSTTMYKCYVDNTTGANNIFQGKLKGDELYEAGKRVSTKDYVSEREDAAKRYADSGDDKIREDLAKVEDLKRSNLMTWFDSTMLNAPARMRFKYGTYALTHSPKQFTWDPDKGWLFISLVSDNGVDMTRYLINDTIDVDMEHGPLSPSGITTRQIKTGR